MSDKLIEVLQDLKKSNKAKDTDFIFPDEKGDFQNPDIMTEEKFHPLINKAGFENIKFIDLRDSYIALLLAENISFSYIKEQVGCSNLNNLEAQFKKFIPEQKKNFCLI